jgi:AraC-like DNA-binding protein
VHIQSVFFDDHIAGWHKTESVTPHDMLILVCGGSVAYQLDGTRLSLHKGHLLYIPKGTLRAARNESGEHQKYSAQFLDETSKTLLLSEDRPFALVATRNSDYLKQRFSVLAQQWYGRLSHYEYICEGIVRELLGLLAREIGEEQFSSIKLRLVKEVQEYIWNHYREPVKIENLSKVIDRAPNYVTQTFKQITGVTPIAYLHQVRIQHAKDLIVHSQLSIGQIADYLGYSDQAYFNRMFRRLMGQPPSHLRLER